MHKAGSPGPAVQSGAAGATPGDAAGEPLTVPGGQAETRGRIHDLASRACSLEGAQEHTASKADVEKAGNRLIIPGTAAAISIPAALFSASRLFLLPRGGCRARVQTSSVRGLSRGHCEQAEHGVRRRGEAVIVRDSGRCGTDCECAVSGNRPRAGVQLPAVIGEPGKPWGGHAAASRRAEGALRIQLRIAVGHGPDPERLRGLIREPHPACRLRVLVAQMPKLAPKRFEPARAWRSDPAPPRARDAETEPEGPRQREGDSPGDHGPTPPPSRLPPGPPVSSCSSALMHAGCPDAAVQTTRTTPNHLADRRTETQGCGGSDGMQPPLRHLATPGAPMPERPERSLRTAA